MYPGVISVKALDDHKLLLKFDTGETKIIDLKPVLDFGRFSELKDEKMFKTAKVSFDTVEWANKLDLDPEYLYEESVEYRVDS
jgi:hypothetical protein